MSFLLWYEFLILLRNTVIIIASYIIDIQFQGLPKHIMIVAEIVTELSISFMHNHRAPIRPSILRSKPLASQPQMRAAYFKILARALTALAHLNLKCIPQQI